MCNPNLLRLIFLHTVFNEIIKCQIWWPNSRTNFMTYVAKPAGFFFFSNNICSHQEMALSYGYSFEAYSQKEKEIRPVV
jgi:hypothetical protein